MIGITMVENEDGKCNGRIVEYCGTDGEITALCCLAVCKAARMQRMPASKVLMEIESYLEEFERILDDGTVISI